METAITLVIFMSLALPTQVSTQGKRPLIPSVHFKYKFSHMIRPHPGQYSMPGYHDPMGFASPFTTGNFYLIIKRTNKLIAISMIKKGGPILREYTAGPSMLIKTCLDVLGIESYRPL